MGAAFLFRLVLLHAGEASIGAIQAFSITFPARDGLE
jgi:hypothetical protein